MERTSGRLLLPPAACPCSQVLNTHGPDQPITGPVAGCCSLPLTGTGRQAAGCCCRVSQPSAGPAGLAGCCSLPVQLPFDMHEQDLCWWWYFVWFAWLLSPILLTQAQCWFTCKGFDLKTLISTPVIVTVTYCLALAAAVNGLSHQGSLWLLVLVLGQRQWLTD